MWGRSLLCVSHSVGPGTLHVPPVQSSEPGRLPWRGRWAHGTRGRRTRSDQSSGQPAPALQRWRGLEGWTEEQSGLILMNNKAGRNIYINNVLNDHMQCNSYVQICRPPLSMEHNFLGIINHICTLLTSWLNIVVQLKGFIFPLSNRAQYQMFTTQSTNRVHNNDIEISIEEL